MYTDTQIFTTNKEEMLTIIVVLISVTGLMIIAGIYNYLPLHILYSLCLQEASQLVMVFYLVE